MATQRLPVPGEENWANILNSFLLVSHEEDGTLRTSALEESEVELIAHKGQPSGYASLDSGSKVPMSQLQPYPMPKQSVEVCMTTPVNIASPGPTLDGITLTKGARVLLVGQAPTNPGHSNGIYSFNGPTTAMTRTADANTGPLVQNAFVYVNQGSQAQSGWVNTTPGPIGINATPLTWKQFEAPILSQPAGQLNDSNGNPVLLATPSETPVNQFTMTNAPSGAAPILSSSGTDANVGMTLDTQGNGAITAQSAFSITNPNGGPDLLIQNSSGSDSILRVQGWSNKAAFIFINSQNVAYGSLTGQIAGATKWAVGRQGSNNGVSVYTGTSGNKQAVQFDDNQTTRFSGGIAYKRTAITSASYTAAINDYLIAYTGPPQPVTITLPSASAVGTTGTQAQIIIVKDEAGVAGDIPITITKPGGGTIDGLPQQVRTDFGSLRFYSDGTNWHVLR